MPRGPRLVFDNAIFHVTIRGNNKRCIFRRDCDFNYFKTLLMRYKKRFKFLLYHYALMKNHVHLSMKIANKSSLSKIMQGLQLSYNHYQKRRYGYVGYLWQGRFNSHLIEDDEYMLTSALYIEKNPFEAGLVEDPAEYPWSSYRYYAFGEEDPLVSPDPLYIQLGDEPSHRQVRYRYLMAERMEESGREKADEST
jgi:putative transposase